MDKLTKGWGLAVGIAGVVVASPLVGYLPPKYATGVLAVAAALLAANGHLVPNGHKD